MTTDEWLRFAQTDADRRGLPELKPLLEMLADATRALRGATWNRDAAGPPAARTSSSSEAPPQTAQCGRLPPR